MASGYGASDTAVRIAVIAVDEILERLLAAGR